MTLRSLATRLTSAAALTAALVLSRDAHADPGPGTKMAVVDVQRALTLTEDGLRASATLKKLFDPRKMEYEHRQGELQKQKEDLDRQAVQLGKAAYTQKLQDLQGAAQELEGAMMAANKEFEKKQRELTDPIFERIMAIVKRLATTEGYDLVVDRNSLTYTRNDIDLTDKCIQQYNSGAPTPAAAPDGKTPAPPAATQSAPAPVKQPTPAPTKR